MFAQEYYQLGAQPSVIRALFAYGQMRAKEVGPDKVYDFSIGNPSIPSPKAVGQAIEEINREMDPVVLHGYTLAQGLEGARKAIAEDLSKRGSTKVEPGELFLTCGAAPALISVIKALRAEPDSEFVLLAPFFPEYVPFVKSSGGVPVIVPAEMDSFQIPLKALEERIGPKTQAVIVNSPNNPSGAIYSRESLEALAELLRRKGEELGHPIYIIADEPYRELVYDGEELPFIPDIYDDCLVCYSWSKSLSLPGERIGYVYVPGAAQDGKELFTAVAGAARAIGHVCPPSMMQLVIERCAGERPDLAAYDENRKLLYNSLSAMGYTCVKPQGAFYLLVKAPQGDAVAFSDRARDLYDLLVVPADGFGCPGWFRLSYCVSSEMIKSSLPAFEAMLKEKF